MSLSVSTAWNESLAFARREAKWVLPIAFLLMALPAAFLQAVAPVTAPGRLPEPGLWLLLAAAVPAASLVGALAICRLVLRADEGAGAAFATGLRRLLPLAGAALLIGLAALVLMAASVLLARALGSLLPALVMLVPLGFAWVRLVLLTPIAAVEPLGPLALIRRGWALTAGHFWRLLLLLLAVALLSLAALIAAGALGGVAARLAGGQPQPGLPALLIVLLVSALLQAAIGGLFTILLARLYAQLADDS